MSIISQKIVQKRKARTRRIIQQSLQSNTFIEKQEYFLHWTADKGGSWGCVSLQHIKKLPFRITLMFKSVIMAFFKLGWNN